ncbi:50S ribosomal protein L11 methyltransferase [Serratia symbiotica]|nr:50S ribosomal protein L11 methyltransferase [Serratia symbiotica]
MPDLDVVNVILDPGLAFGTGTHPTTVLCLQWLDSLNLAGKTVTDFGCGSGIIAIAALKLGAECAIGIDIDPQAILRLVVIMHNVTVFQSAWSCICQMTSRPKTLADVVVANILAGTLRELAPLIGCLPKIGGHLGLSGILASQAKSVAEAYEEQFVLDAITECEEWCRITGCRK